MFSKPYKVNLNKKETKRLFGKVRQQKNKREFERTLLYFLGVFEVGGGGFRLPPDRLYCFDSLFLVCACVFLFGGGAGWVG